VTEGGPPDGPTSRDEGQTAGSSAYEADVEADDDPVPELVGMFGQWCPDVELGELPEDELPLVELPLVELPLDPDVDEDVLRAVVAWVPVDGCVEAAPAASIPMPRLSPAAPATAATAMTGCLIFITCPFAVVTHGPIRPCRQ
jgi:hypothetical protein